MVKKETAYVIDYTYLETQLCSYPSYLPSVVRLHSSNTNEGIAALLKSFWNEIPLWCYQKLFFSSGQSGVIDSNFRVLFPPNAIPELQSSLFAHIETFPPRASDILGR